MRLSKFVAVLATVSTLAVCGAALAQKAPPDPARQAAAKALLEASGGMAQATKAMEQMKIAFINEIRARNPAEAPQAQAFFDEAFSPTNPRIRTYLGEVEAVILAFYAEHFTVAELEAIARFQASPEGRKFQDLAPQMAASIAGPLIRFQDGLMRDMQAKRKQ